MAKQQAAFTITCDVCGFSGSASNEDSANVVAARHAGDTHRDIEQAHVLGRHIRVTASGAAAASE